MGYNKLNLKKEIPFEQIPSFMYSIERHISNLTNRILTLEKTNKQLSNAKQLFDVKEAMQMLNYSNQTSFLKTVRDKNIPCIHLSRKKILFDVNELENYIQQNYSTYKQQMLLKKRDDFLGRKGLDL